MKIIGQEKLLEKINILLNTGFPRFTIIQGGKGSGRTLIARHISQALNANFAVISEITTEEIRNLINLSYRISSPTVYLILNSENMHSAAKNALLKVTEEPPAKAYFIFTTQDAGNLLDTLLSRATTLRMDNYTKEEKLTYIKSKYFGKSGNILDNEIAENIDYVLEVCDTFLEIDLFISYGISEFRKFCELTVRNIRTVNLANAFKMPTRLKLKEDSEGYDPVLFLKTIAHELIIILRKSFQSSLYEDIAATFQCINELSMKGVSKIATIDNWIMIMQGLK